MVGSLLRSKDCSGIFGKDATESFQKTFLVPAVSWNLSLMVNKECYLLDFLGGPVLKNLSANTGDTSLLPDLGGFHKPRGS